MSVFFPDDPTKPYPTIPDPTKLHLAKLHPNIPNPINPVMSPGQLRLNIVVLTLPRPVDWVFDGFVELAECAPSRVLELVGDEILERFNRREISTRPTVAEIHEMCRIAMAMRHEVGSVLAKKPARVYPKRPSAKQTTGKNKFRRLA